MQKAILSGYFQLTLVLSRATVPLHTAEGLQMKVDVDGSQQLFNKYSVWWIMSFAG